MSERKPLDDRFAEVAEALFDQVVATHGQRFPNVIVAKNLGAPNECWSNARERVNKNPKLRYAEGFALKLQNGQPKAWRHAFCVDKRGTVIEVTPDYEDVVSYAGIILNIDAVNDIDRIERQIFEQGKRDPLIQQMSAGSDQTFRSVSALQMALWTARQNEPGGKEMLEWLMGLNTPTRSGL